MNFGTDRKPEGTVLNAFFEDYGTRTALSGNDTEVDLAFIADFESSMKAWVNAQLNSLVNRNLNRMVMKHYICIFLLSICISLPFFASSPLSRDSHARIDSLCFVALNHTNHGRYEESNAIIYNIMENYKLPKGSTRFMYGIMGQNAWLSGDYPLYYRCMSKSLKRKELKNQFFQKAFSLLPPESLSRTDDEIDIMFEVDSLFYEGEFKGCEMRIPTVIGGKEEKMILDNGCAFFSLACESFAREHGIRPIGIGERRLALLIMFPCG